MCNDRPSTPHSIICYNKFRIYGRSSLFVEVSTRSSSTIDVIEILKSMNFTAIDRFTGSFEDSIVTKHSTITHLI